MEISSTESSLNQQNQSPVGEKDDQISCATQSTQQKAKTAGVLISNTMDSPQKILLQLELVQSNSPTEQFTDRKKSSSFSSSLNSKECIQMETCTQQMMKSKKVTMEYGMKITSNQNTEETLIYGYKHGSSATTKMKSTLTQHSTGGSSKRKNENHAKTCQESNGKQHLSISPIILKLKEGGELREERKGVKTVNAVNRNVETKNKGKKKRKTNLTEKKREENRIPDVTITPNTERKRKLTDKEIHQQKKRKTEEIVKVTVGENRRETWVNLI